MIFFWLHVKKRPKRHVFFLYSARSPHRTAKPSRGCLPLAHPRALPSVIISDRRSPSAMCEFPFECWGCKNNNNKTNRRRVWSGQALATTFFTGTAWAGLCLVHHQQPTERATRESTGPAAWCVCFQVAKPPRLKSGGIHFRNRARPRASAVV